MLTENEGVSVKQNRTKVLATVTKNAVANLLRISASWIVVLFLPPILVRVLDKPTYATWMLILQLGIYVTLFDNGIQSAVGRFVARAEELNDGDSMRNTLSSATVILVAGSLVVAIATLLCSSQLEHLFNGIPSSILPAARNALIVIGLSFAMNLPFSTFAGAFLGLQKNEINAFAGSLGKLLGAAGAAWAAWHHEGIFVMALWIAFGNAVQSLIFLIIGKRFGFQKFVRRAYVSLSAIREFAHFCYAMFATQLSAVLITGLDMPIVAAFDFHSAGYYAVAATVGNMLGVPQAAIVNPLIPVASGMSAVRTPEQFGETLVRTTRYANAILCLLTLTLLYVLMPFLRIWVGKDYAFHTITLAVILIVAQFVRLTLTVYAALGFAAGQQHRMLISPLGEGIVNLGCSIAGAIWLGAVGVALGTLIGAVVGVILHFINSMPRTDSMKFSRHHLIFSGILKPMLCCLPSLALMLVSERLHSGAAEVTVIIFGEILAIAFLWANNFNSDERIEILAIVRRTRMLSRWPHKLGTQ